MKRRYRRSGRCHHACSTDRGGRIGKKRDARRADGEKRGHEALLGKEILTEEGTSHHGCSCLVLERLQANRLRKGVWYPEEGNRDGRRGRRHSIASQTLSPRESPMCSLCTGKGSSRRGRSWWGRLRESDVDTLLAKEFDPRPSMEATLPVSPQDGVSSQRHRRWLLELGGRALGMQHRADAPWVFGGGAMPLTALT